jgi:protein TorT
MYTRAIFCTLWALFCAVLIVAPTSKAVAAAQAWYPVDIDVWQPPFNAQRQRSQITYMPLEKASRSWQICASIPHLKDAYWLAVNYALITEARRLGVGLSLYEAGGYEYLDMQREHIKQCLDDGVDGLIVSAISEDGLEDLLAKAKSQGVPVVDLINGMQSTHISARVAADFWDAGSLIGTYLLEKQEDGEKALKVAWFPGPSGASWVSAGNAGFTEAIRDSNIEVVATRYGDTGQAAQSQLVEEVLDQHGNELDYIAGTAVTASAAVEVLRKRGMTNDVGVLAYYYSPGVHRGIRRGTILAAPSDQQALQARIAVDVMVRILEKKEFVQHAAPRPVLVDRPKLQDWDTSTTLAPRGFRPVYSTSN